jgi:tRNA 2-thiouridine synthesizing protein E
MLFSSRVARWARPRSLQTISGELMQSYTEVGPGSIFEWNDIRLQVDEDGFMQEPERWDEQVALALASTEGLSELTDAHWKIINYIRDYYHQFQIAPMIRKMVKETGYSLREIYEFFPSGPAKGACKVAGLPKPTGCV